MKALYSVEWLESERGWGTRPDGYSFHKTEGDALAFVKKFQDNQPTDYVPDEYSMPVGNPKLLVVSESLYNFIMVKGDAWLWKNNPDAYKTYDASVHYDKGVQ